MYRELQINRWKFHARTPHRPMYYNILYTVEKGSPSCLFLEAENAPSKNRRRPGIEMLFSKCSPTKYVCYTIKKGMILLYPSFFFLIYQITSDAVVRLRRLLTRTMSFM